MAHLVATMILLVLCSFSALAFSSGQAADDATCKWLDEGVDAACKDAGQFSDRCASVGQLATERGCRGDAPTHADVGEDTAAGYRRRRKDIRRRRSLTKKCDSSGCCESSGCVMTTDWTTVQDAPVWYQGKFPLDIRNSMLNGKKISIESPCCDGPANLQSYTNGATSVEIKADGTIVKRREMLLLRKLNTTNVNKETPFLVSRESGNEIRTFDDTTAPEFHKSQYNSQTMAANGKSKCTCNGKITNGICSSSGTPDWLRLTTECGGKKSAVSCPAFCHIKNNIGCLFLNSGGAMDPSLGTNTGALHPISYKQKLAAAAAAKAVSDCKVMMANATRADNMHRIKAKLTKTLKPRPCKSLLNLPSTKGCVTYEVTKICEFDFGIYPHPKFKVSDIVTADTNRGLKIECAAL